MDAWEHSAANPIAHYHATFQDTVPFPPKWLESAQEGVGVGVDAQAAKYLQDMESTVKPRAEELRIRANSS
ncbi:hypothetical protein ABVK25_005057 [Lepraria finkii]|uniref:Uncharacterized protein n=1 Tax=Lepraria finkii TaxID=1340010 RepID=A0ABR4BBF3_9LECA